MLNNTEKIEKNQDEFEFLEKPSEKKAKMNDFLEKIKNKVSEKMSLKIFECGDIVGFLKSKGEKIRLHGGNFCNNRFCPLCSWRKAKKDGYLLMLLFSVVQKIHKKELIFLTLTAPNVVSELLEMEIKDFNKAFKRLSEIREFKNICKGYVRKLEVTYNAKNNTYHPHFHVVIAVNKSYFTDSKSYINQKKWLEMWQVAKRNPKITQVDIRKARIDDMKDVYEMATYSAKASDYLYSEDTFDTFYNALKGKQLITFNGLFKEILKEIKAGEHSELIESDGEIYNKQLWFNWIEEKYKLFRTDELSDSEMQKIYVDEIEID